MSAQHHYISQFHLKQFTDPDSLNTEVPWLWQGFVPDGPVNRRAPKKVGRRPGMFDGPGGLADRDSTIESFLANEVEGPAAKAIKELCRRSPDSGAEIAPPLSRYLAWAAARSLPMQQLENFWGKKGIGRNDDGVESPPEGLLSGTDMQRDVQMCHPTLGCRVFPAGSDLAQTTAEGWYPDMTERVNFLEGVHIQAYYFQARFFPRFNWFALHAPEGYFFIIANRAVGWAADGYVNAPPSCLRDPSAYVLAPISRSLVLVGRHSTEKWNVSPDRINAIITCWAHDWIAGPTRATVDAALKSRRLALSGMQFP